MSTLKAKSFLWLVIEEDVKELYSGWHGKKLSHIVNYMARDYMARNLRWFLDAESECQLIASRKMATPVQ